MSRMFGWDLPPGCSVSDLPGNSKSEQDAEAFYNLIYDQFPRGMTDNEMEKLADWVWNQINKAYEEGYKQAQADEAEAKEFAEEREREVE